jgi:hypothetical protein
LVGTSLFTLVWATSCGYNNEITSDTKQKTLASDNSSSEARILQETVSSDAFSHIESSQETTSAEAEDKPEKIRAFAFSVDDIVKANTKMELLKQYGSVRIENSCLQFEGADKGRNVTQTCYFEGDLIYYNDGLSDGECDFYTRDRGYSFNPDADPENSRDQ